MNRSISFSISLPFSINTNEKTFFSSIVALIMPNKYHLLTRLGQQPAAYLLKTALHSISVHSNRIFPLNYNNSYSDINFDLLICCPSLTIWLKGFWALVLFLNWNDLSLMVFSASFFGLSFTRIILNKQSLIQLK